jgi:hypothetical protein
MLRVVKMISESNITLNSCDASGSGVDLAQSYASCIGEKFGEFCTPSALAVPRLTVTTVK